MIPGIDYAAPTRHHELLIVDHVYKIGKIDPRALKYLGHEAGSMTRLSCSMIVAAEGLHATLVGNMRTAQTLL